MDKLIGDIMKEILGSVINQATNTSANTNKKKPTTSTTTKKETTKKESTSMVSASTYMKAVFLDHVANEPYPKASYSTSITKLIGDVDPKQFHKALIDNGLLVSPSISDALMNYKSTDLKVLLEKKKLKTTGKKEELIESLVEVLSTTEKNSIIKKANMYVLSTKGKNYIDKYSEYVFIAKKSSRYKITMQEYIDYNKANPDKSLFELLRIIVRDHMKAAKNNYSKLAGFELDLAELYEDEMKETNKNKNKDMLLHQLKYIYYSLNTSDEIEAILNGTTKSTKATDRFNTTITKYLESHAESYINYDFKALPEDSSYPYCICPKKLLQQLIQDVATNPRISYRRYTITINQQEDELKAKLTKTMKKK